MDKTAYIARKTFREINAEKMASLTDKRRDKATIGFVLRFLSKCDKILDLACGYGRITIPLAKRGFNISGLDIAPNLIKSAKNNAKKRGLSINFKVGDMRRLPYSNKSFNKILCLWSSFGHLLTKNDQLSALKEIQRVLKKGGMCIIDSPNFENKWTKEQIRKHGRIDVHIIDGTKVISYLHDKKSIESLLKTIKFSKHSIKLTNLGGRKRIIIALVK